MSLKFKNFSHSKTTLLVSAFLVGCFSHYAVTADLLASDKKISTMKPLKIEDVNDFDKQFEHIQKLHERWMKDNSSFFKNAFDDKFTANFNDELNISLREDDNYKYIDIDTKNLKKDSVKIDIKEGMVTIKSEVKDSKKIDKDNSRSYSSFSSSFSQSFNVPEGVDQNKAEILNENQKNGNMTIKFPKFKYTS